MTGNYLYRTRRIGGRVVRRYIGRKSDPWNQLLDRNRKLDKAIHKDAIRKNLAECDQSQQIEDRVKRLVEFVELHHLIAPRLEDRAHNLSQPQNPTVPSVADSALQSQGSAQVIPDRESVWSLCRRADEGDADALQELNALLRQLPDLVAEMADLVTVTKLMVIDAVAGDSPSSRAVASQTIANMIAQLSACATDPVDRMYAEIAAVTWMDAMRCSTASAREPATRHTGRFWSAQANKAINRFNRVMRALREHQSMAEPKTSPPP